MTLIWSPSSETDWPSQKRRKRGSSRRRGGTNMTADSNLARCRPCSHSSRSPRSGVSHSSRSRTRSSSTRSSRSWPFASRSPRSSWPLRRPDGCGRSDGRAGSPVQHLASCSPSATGSRRQGSSARPSRARASSPGCTSSSRLCSRSPSSGRAWPARSGSASGSQSSGSRCSRESAPAIRVGDLLVLLGSAAYSVQIVLMERYAPRYDPIAFTQVEMLAAFGGFAVVAVGLGQLEVPHGWTVWSALLVTGIFASALAFLVQTWAQRRTTATSTALAFAMEPVFAGFFGFWLAGDRLGAIGWARLRVDHGRDRGRRARGRADAAAPRCSHLIRSTCEARCRVQACTSSCDASRSRSPPDPIRVYHTSSALL